MVKVAPVYKRFNLVTFSFYGWALFGGNWKKMTDSKEVRPATNEGIQQYYITKIEELQVMLYDYGVLV